jgi:hypothetical protein
VGYEEDIDEDDVESAEKEEEVQQEQDSEALEKVQAKLAKSGKPVITYISRQDWGRRMLKPESHASLVEELKKLEEKYGWEVNIVSMDKLTRDEQIRLSAKSTVSGPEYWCRRSLMVRSCAAFMATVSPIYSG